MPKSGDRPERSGRSPSKSGADKKRDIRSMRDAVDEIMNFDETERPRSADIPKPRKQRDIRSMSEAVDEIRVDRRKAPDKKRRSAKKKKRRAIWSDVFSRSRRAGEGFTVFGRRLTFWPVFCGVFALLLLVLVLLNSTSLVVDKTDAVIAGLNSDLEGYRILVLSDLNGKRFGDNQSTLLREIGNMNYDIVICLGDMVGEDGDAEPFYELLEGLPSRKKVYFICGDSDPGPYVSQVRGEGEALESLVLADWILGATERGAIYVDSPVSITVGAAKLWLTPSDMLNVEASVTAQIWKEQVAQEESGYLTGIIADKQTLPFTTYRYTLAQKLFNAIAEMNDADIHITLSHVPVSDSMLASSLNHPVNEGKYLYPPDLALAGHYCGGIWNLPGGAAFYVPDSSLANYGWLPEQARVSGMREVSDVLVYVSRGLSNCGDVSAMPFRFLNNPQISVLTLTAAMTTNMLD